MAEATEQIIKVRQRRRPNRRRAEFYAKQYGQYAALYPTLRERFAELGT